MIRSLTVPDLRLAVPAAVLWIGSGIAVTLVDARPVAVVAAVLVLGAAGAAALLRHRPALAAASAVTSLAAALLVLGLAVVSARAPEYRPAPALAAARAGWTVTMQLRTEGDVVGGRVGAVVERMRVGEREWAVRMPVMLFSGVEPGTRVGTPLRVQGTLRATPRGDPTSFLVFARGSASVLGRPPPLLDGLGRMRTGFAAVAATLPGDGGALLPGLAIGDTSAVSDGLRADMRTASLAHLTAVSGANCAVVVGLVLGLTTALGLPRLLRLGLSAAALALFVVLVTPQASVLRAAAMASLVLLATALGRPVRGLPVLAAAVIGLLLADPWLARDYGFALSVLASGGLLLLAPALVKRVATVLPESLALVISVPLAAQLATQPVLVMLTPALPLWGVPANLLAGPAAPIATVFGLIACLLLPIAPPLGQAAAALAWLPSAWIAGVARTVARLPGATIPWLPGLGGVVLAAVLSAAILLVVLPGPRRLRVLAATLLAVTAAGGGGVLLGSTVMAQSGRPADWQYAECDVGQGDATVIRSAGAVAVIDTGPDPERMRACLDRLGIGRIDLLVLSHYDLDHVGGTAALVGRVGRVLIGPSSGADDDRVALALQRGGARVDQVASGASGRLGRLEWTVLWPPPRGVEPGNAASVTLSVTAAPGCSGACLSALLLGDIGAESQQRMLGSAQPGSYDLVKVAHHGSADQWPELYRRVGATVGLIGVGVGNGYGHPTSFALGALADAGTRAFRTDRDGLVLVADGGGGTARVWTERSSPGSRVPGGG